MNIIKDESGASPEFHQVIIDSVADPIMVIDTNYRVIFMNRAARNIAVGEFPASQPLFCYQLSHRLTAPCNDTAHPCPLEQVRRLGHPVSVIHEHCQANDEKRLIEVNAAPLTKNDGTFLGIIESMRDITKRHQTEVALHQSTKRLRALTSQLAQVTEKERKRLSQDLHDQIGQNLTALGININIIRTEITPQATPALLSRLDDSLALVAQTTERIRDVMANLRPPVLDDYGLVAALKWYGRRFNQRTNIDMKVNAEKLSPRLSPRLENVLFRIAQEALTNVAKHAQADTVVVSVKESKEIVKLVIADDGIGFDPASLTTGENNKGWGIITMMERAEAEGGRCRVESQSAGGTSVIVEVNR